MDHSLNEIIHRLQTLFAGSADLTIREIVLQTPVKTRAALVTMEGMVDKEGLAQAAVNPLMAYRFADATPQAVCRTILDRVLASSDVTKLESFDELLTFITAGFAALVVDGAPGCIAIGAQGYAFRGVAEPESEVVQRGAREGFTEPLRVNMSLLRRRLKTPDLVFEQVTVGAKSRTQLMLCYLRSAASPMLVEQVRRRLAACHLETVLAAGYLSEYLEDKHTSRLFSGVGISERPDTVCGKLTEGRVAVMVDGTPAVLLVPHLFVEEFQGVDDYSNRSYYATFIRTLKYISFFISVFLPAIYTALAQFHPEYFPTWILVKTASSLAQTPLPVTLEVLLITFVYEIMKEAGLRIPKSLGHAVSIVGALVIGDSAVTAGIISSSTLMVVATAAICSYVTSPLYPPVMMLRFVMIVAGGVLGLWGIVLATALVLISMCSKTSLGVPYLSSLSPFSWHTMRDVLLRASWKKLGNHTMQVQRFAETEEIA